MIHDVIVSNLEQILKTDFIVSLLTLNAFHLARPAISEKAIWNGLDSCYVCFLGLTKESECRRKSR